MSENHTAICVDASLVIRFFVETAESGIAQLWRHWQSERRPLIAPALIHYEVANGLHKYVVSGERTGREMAHALGLAIELPVEIVDDDDLHRQAMAMAARVAISSVYDAHYLALAERLGIEFWTLDKRLFNAVHAQLPWVTLVAS